jgi:antirestriction protein ArdC
MSISLSNASGTEITIEKSTAYVQSWLKALKSDERMAFVASQAQRAADHITNV